MTLNLNTTQYEQKLRTIKYSLATCLFLVLFTVLSLVVLLVPARADSINATDFVTTWKTDNEGVSNDSSITIPTDGGGYNYSVDWNNDGIIDQTGITGNVTHDFGAPGEYTIRIQGDFPRIYFNTPSDNKKLININQWGTNPWTSMQNAFYGADNLAITATDTPNLSNVTDTSFMFYTTDFTGDLSNWDVSNVTNMSSMFASSNFNNDLSNWDVSNVTDMSYMFQGAASFSDDLSGWNVSNVSDTMLMFAGATQFNGNLSSWNVSNVTSMYGMFNNSGLSTENYDALLIGWAGQALQQEVSFGVTGLVYCDAVNQRQSIIDTFGWSIEGDTECVVAVEKEITEVAIYVDDNGKKTMHITGTGLVGETEYFEGTSRSLVTLEGQELPLCSEGTGFTAADWTSALGVPAHLVSDNNPCYYFVNSEFEPVITSTQAIIHLPDDFDIAAQGTVSVNGSSTFIFNTGTTPEEPEEPVDPTNPETIQPTARANGTKPLDQNPVLSKRPTFSGVATPGAAVVVTVHSDPVSCSATANSTGDWSCTLPTDLVPGAHTVYVQVTNPDGTIQNLGPYAVTVAGEETTVSNNMPLAPNTGFFQALNEYKQTQAANKALALIVMIVALTAALATVFATACVVKSRRRAVQLERQ